MQGCLCRARWDPPASPGAPGPPLYAGAPSSGPNASAPAIDGRCVVAPAPDGSGTAGGAWCYVAPGSCDGGRTLTSGRTGPAHAPWDFCSSPAYDGERSSDAPRTQAALGSLPLPPAGGAYAPGGYSFTTQGGCGCSPWDWNHYDPVSGAPAGSFIGCADADPSALPFGSWCPVDPRNCSNFCGTFTSKSGSILFHYDYCGPVRAKTASGCLCAGNWTDSANQSHPGNECATTPDRPDRAWCYVNPASCPGPPAGTDPPRDTPWDWCLPPGAEDAAGAPAAAPPCVESVYLGITCPDAPPPAAAPAAAAPAAPAPAPEAAYAAAGAPPPADPQPDGGGGGGGGGGPPVAAIGAPVAAVGALLAAAAAFGLWRSHKLSVWWHRAAGAVRPGLKPAPKGGGGGGSGGGFFGSLGPHLGTGGAHDSRRPLFAAAAAVAGASSGGGGGVGGAGVPLLGYAGDEFFQPGAPNVDYSRPIAGPHSPPRPPASPDRRPPHSPSGTGGSAAPPPAGPPHPLPPPPPQHQLGGGRVASYGSSFHPWASGEPSQLAPAAPSPAAPGTPGAAPPRSPGGGPPRLSLSSGVGSFHTGGSSARDVAVSVAPASPGGAAAGYGRKSADVAAAAAAVRAAAAEAAAAKARREADEAAAAAAAEAAAAAAAEAAAAAAREAERRVVRLFLQIAVVADPHQTLRKRDMVRLWLVPIDAEAQQLLREVVRLWLVPVDGDEGRPSGSSGPSSGGPRGVEVILPSDPVRCGVDLGMALSDLQFPVYSFIGAGAFGQVHRAILRGRIPVAVKLLSSAGASDGGTAANLVEELQIMSRVPDHRNIVKCYGGSEAPPELFIVEELMDMNLSHLELMDMNLSHLVHGGQGRARPPPLPLRRVLEVAADVAAGLALLHPTIPQNILLSTSGVAKIADFGISRMKAETYLATAVSQAGTVTYMAPECFTAGGATGHKVSEKSDIYSLAVLMWEMLTGLRPWAEYSHQMAIIYQQMAIIYQVVQCDRRPPWPKGFNHVPEAIKKLIACCWRRNPRRAPQLFDGVERPSAADVLKRLEALLRQLPAA
ncbi:MAG: hypothetical protein J3K34DRAFT_527865 [Monoraphidium minutum]|nr:MAG: hypothetical protein J3K34DRAFT_527865 [Monoraphidium minutum]